MRAYHGINGAETMPKSTPTKEPFMNKGKKTGPILMVFPKVPGCGSGLVRISKGSLAKDWGKEIE
jgi:hypothetical protein